MGLTIKTEERLKSAFGLGNGTFEEAAEMYGRTAKRYQPAKR
jgi:hypothetical protein